MNPPYFIIKRSGLTEKIQLSYQKNPLMNTHQRMTQKYPLSLERFRVLLSIWCFACSLALGHSSVALAESSTSILQPFFQNSPTKASDVPDSSPNQSLLSQSNAQAGRVEFLDPNIAFQLTTSEDETHLYWDWLIEPGYYLYKKQFAVQAILDESASVQHQSSNLAQSSKPLFEFQLSDGEHQVDDPDFGRVPVYYQQVRLSLEKALIPENSVKIKVRYQGCAEAGLCYPPQFHIQNAPQTPPGKDAVKINTPTPQLAPGASQSRDWTNILSTFDLNSLLLLFFTGGLLLTFTPCVLPMIPILSAIIMGDANRTNTREADPPSHNSLRGLLLSTSYVLGMALTYAAAGVIAGLLGARFNVQLYMQSPWVLVPFTLIFVVLALGMFGFFELQLPSSLRDRLNQRSQNLKGGQYLGVFLIGALSAIVVSPCVSAPLAGALVYISSTGDAVLGGLSLLALGFGMGAPLVLIGATGAKCLPKAGPYLLHIKQFFGVMLLAVAIVFLERLIPAHWGLLLWSLLIGIYGVHLGALEPALSGIAKTCKGLGLFLLLYAGLLFIGAAMGHKTLWPPLPQLSLTQQSGDHRQLGYKQPGYKQPDNEAASGNSHSPSSVSSEHAPNTQMIVIEDPKELLPYIERAQSEGKFLMLDLYADWCIACKDMEQQVLYTPEVRHQLANLYWIKLDMTAFNEQHKTFLSDYQLFGPPAFLFFGFNGQEIPEARIVGEVNKQQFLAHLQQFKL